MEQNKMSNMFIVRRLKPTVNQVFSLQEKEIETWHAASLHDCQPVAKSRSSDILLTVDSNLRNI